MLKLPFKTEPKGLEKVVVGNPEIGELEIPKYGDLSPNERIFIKEARLTDLRRVAVQMASTIAAKSGMAITEVYGALVSGNSSKLDQYLAEFVEFQDLMESSAKQRNLVLATCIIRFRLVPDWAIENTQDANQIHPLLAKAIAEFAKGEESGWVEPEEEAEVTEEELGNSTPTPENQTGEKSTGGAEDTGRKKKGFAPTTSEANPPG